MSDHYGPSQARWHTGPGMARNPVGGSIDDVLPPPWSTDALCRQVDVGDLWFPDKGGAVRDAKRICGECRLRVECLQYALDHHERYGIWGGLTERERRRLKDGPR